MSKPKNPKVQQLYYLGNMMKLHANHVKDMIDNTKEEISTQRASGIILPNLKETEESLASAQREYQHALYWYRWAKHQAGKKKTYKATKQL